MKQRGSIKWYTCKLRTTTSKKKPSKKTFENFRFSLREWENGGDHAWLFIAWLIDTHFLVSQLQSTWFFLVIIHSKGCQATIVSTNLIYLAQWNCHFTRQMALISAGQPLWRHFYKKIKSVVKCWCCNFICAM